MKQSYHIGKVLAIGYFDPNVVKKQRDFQMSKSMSYHQSSETSNSLFLT